MARPTLITLSGVDGSGKTTQSKNLVSWLEKETSDSVGYSHSNRKLFGDNQKGVDAATYRPKQWSWPVVILIGLKDVLKIWFFLYQHRGMKFVVSDRYRDDGLVKLRFYHKPIPLLERFILLLTPDPALTLWIDVPVGVSYVRDNEYPESYHAKKQQLYTDWFKLHHDDVARIDGQGTPEEVARLIQQQVRGIL